MVYDKTTTADYPGFPVILWDITFRILCSPICPEYSIYRDEINPSMYEFCANVYIHPDTYLYGHPYNFKGCTLPTQIKLSRWQLRDPLPGFGT